MSHTCVIHVIHMHVLCVGDVRVSRIDVGLFLCALVAGLVSKDLSLTSFLSWTPRPELRIFQVTPRRLLEPCVRGSSVFVGDKTGLYFLIYGLSST